MKKSWVLLGLAIQLAGSGMSQPNSTAPETLTLLNSNFTYRSIGCEFSSSSFQNFEYHYLSSANREQQHVKLRQGSYNSGWQEREGSTEVNLLWSHRIDREHWALATAWEWIGGSSSQETVVQVLKCEHGHAVIVQQITGDAHHAGKNAGASFDAKTEALAITFVDYGNGARCCPEYLDTTHFRWTGQRFRVQSTKKTPMPD